jgi:hypothetical protein
VKAHVLLFVKVIVNQIGFLGVTHPQIAGVAVLRVCLWPRPRRQLAIQKNIGTIPVIRRLLENIKLVYNWTFLDFFLISFKHDVHVFAISLEQVYLYLVLLLAGGLLSVLFDLLELSLSFIQGPLAHERIVLR